MLHSLFHAFYSPAQIIHPVNFYFEFCHISVYWHKINPAISNTFSNALFSILVLYSITGASSNTLVISPTVTLKIFAIFERISNVMLFVPFSIRAYFCQQICYIFITLFLFHVTILCYITQKGANQ